MFRLEIKGLLRVYSLLRPLHLVSPGVPRTPYHLEKETFWHLIAKGALRASLSLTRSTNSLRFFLPQEIAHLFRDRRISLAGLGVLKVYRCVSMVDYPSLSTFFTGDCASYVGPKQPLNVRSTTPFGRSPRLVGDLLNQSLKEFYAVLLFLWVYADSFRVETVNDLPVRKGAAH